MGPNSPTKWRKSAAPVGVQSSPRMEPGRWDALGSFVVAGAGTGMRPCSQRVIPSRRGQESEHARRAEIIIEQAAADDVRDGVHRAHLVKADFLKRRAVHRRLRLAKKAVDGQRVAFDLFGE